MGIKQLQAASNAFRRAWNSSDELQVMDLNLVRQKEKELAHQAQSLTSREVEDHEGVLASENSTAKQRCESYLLLLTHHRRYKNWGKAIELGRQYRNLHLLFPEDGTLRFLSIHTYSILLKETEIPSYIDESVISARKSLELIPNYTGALHNLAGGLLRKANASSLTEHKRSVLLDEALTRVDQALLREPNYAKYHATRARILNLLNRHDEADEEIRKAIDTEDSKNEDYVIRLSDYLDIKSSIALARTTTSIKSEIAASSLNMLNEARRSNIQILTIFIALISFLIGGLTLSASFTFDEAAKLIFLLAAAILLALNGFSILYEGSINIVRIFVALAMSIGLLFLAHIVPITITSG